jgi:hypothetical protein
MSTALDTMGHTVKHISSVKKPEETLVDKNDLLSLIDNSLKAMNDLTTLSTSNKIINELIKRNPKSISNHSFKTAYAAYTKAIGKSESDDYFSYIFKSAEKFLSDLESIRDNFELFFSSGTNPADIEIDQMKATHAALIGYVVGLEKLYMWYIYMVSLIEHQGDNESVPKYREKFVLHFASMIGGFIKYVLIRPSNKNIINDIQDIKSGGHDVFLTTNGKTIDTYTHPTDYTPQIHGMFGYFNYFFAAFRGVSQFVADISRYFYDQRKLSQEWMLTKVALIQMQLNNVSPENPEYEKLEKILKSYSTMITDNAQKIAEYEGRV